MLCLCTHTDGGDIAQVSPECPCHGDNPVRAGYPDGPKPQFSLGALLPPEASWMEGKTAGEIALIRFVIDTLYHLHDEARPPSIVQPANGRLQKEAKELLMWYGVTVPELR